MLRYFWIGIDVDFTNAEPMRQLGLGSGAESYPERPDERDLWVWRTMLVQSFPGPCLVILISPLFTEVFVFVRV